MNTELSRKWSKIFDDLDREREEQTLLERRIIEEERERIKEEIERNSSIIRYEGIQTRGCYQ
jgi:hypothetical protein